MSDVESQPQQADSTVNSTFTGNPHGDSSLSKEPVQSGSANVLVENTIVKLEPEIHVMEDNADAEEDSEAETLIQSPEKKKNIMDGATLLHPSKMIGTSDGGSINVISTSDKENATRKRKRSMEDTQDAMISRTSSRRSSPLSSPVAQIGSDIDSDTQSRSRRRELDEIQMRRNGKHSQSPRSEDGIGLKNKRKRRPSEIVPPVPLHRQNKIHNSDRKDRRETRSATYPQPSGDEGSPSPEPTPRREHRRGASTQLTSHEFDRKKRGRPPLLNVRRNRSVDRASISSETSDSPAPPRPLLNKFSSHDQDNMSPAKVGPRKWRDKNGRTYLARACANDDLEAARARLAERPDDINLPDNAGNTPLQIAALEGFVEIVEFLLQKRANVNSQNIDKDTPLIDSVENGHVDVIRLLLEYGANPRLGNAKGDEPYELAHPDDDNYEEIRRLLANAKNKDDKKQTEPENTETATRDGASSRAASAASPRDSPPVNPRSPPSFGNRRRTGRSESTRNDLLWQANTQENLAKLAGKGDVQGVANILSILEKAETESLIAAAKAGHESVLQLLIAMGSPDNDPPAVRAMKSGFNTPMLAAIGRGHPDVVKLLANQTGFNPMRRWREKTYFEVAQERRGEGWKQEVDILRAAYDKYAASKGRKPSSQLPRRSASPTAVKRQSTSPALTHKTLPGKTSEIQQREKRKVSDPTNEKRRAQVARSNAADSSAIAVSSDHDQAAPSVKKLHRTRRSHSDLPPLPLGEQETTYKRRRLVTGKEHRSRQSAANSSDAETEDAFEVKQEDKLVPALKRARSSLTPEPTPEDSEKTGAITKKRRTVLESSPEDSRTTSKAMPSPPPSVAIDTEPNSKEHSEEKPRDTDQGQSELERQASPLANGVEAAAPQHVPVLEVTTDPEILPDADQVQNTTIKETRQIEASIEAFAKTKIPELSNTLLSSKDSEEEAQEEAKRAAQVAQAVAVREAEAAQAARMAKLEEDRAEEERKAAEKRAVEAEAKAKAEAEAEAQAQAESRRKADEEAQAKRKAEEERQEQLRRDLEDQLRLQQLEDERRRVESLPIVLCKTAQMLDENNPSVRTPAWLNKFLPLFTVKSSQLESNCDGAWADELWIPNFQAAGLLATKDLNLRNFSSFGRRYATDHHRVCLWRVARNMLSYDYNANGWNTSVKKALEIEDRERPKFEAMEELFWVKLSDLKAQVFQYPHLTNIAFRTQPMSLKTYAEITSNANTQVNGGPHSPDTMTNGAPPNGTTLPYTNGIDHIGG